MPKFFIPARNARHRTACFALYRALLRQAGQVPVPEGLVPSEPQPLQALVRRGFRHNRADTSRRLVLSGLRQGYKFLSLLAEAKQASSPAHQSVLAFLQKPAATTAFAELEEKRKKWASKRAAASDSAAPAEASPPRVPLLTRRWIPEATGASPDGQFVYRYYEYVPTLPPRRRRQVPVLTADAAGIPFLRLRRPQPEALSQLIRTRSRRRRDRQELVSRLIREELPFALQEDAWESIVQKLLHQSQKPGRGSSSTAADDDESSAEGTSYAAAVRIGARYISGKLSAEYADTMARAKALLQIVDAERALAEQAKAEEEKEGRFETKEAMELGAEEMEAGGGNKKKQRRDGRQNTAEKPEQGHQTM